MTGPANTPGTADDPDGSFQGNNEVDIGTTGEFSP